MTGAVAAAEAAPSIAVSVLRADQIQTMAPISATDLLKNVPGVFVNSVLGETRNIVYSRGVSANSVDGNGGYYYVSLQEDGLPVTNITASNYGPDFFYRQDISLARLEALRGGTAVVTGPNAPGGIFNYISRNGENSPGNEVRSRVGLLGDGRNPYYRVDGYSGGETGIDNLYYAVSGFYRYDKGSRDPGYAFNEGGQIKANLLYHGDMTRVQVSAKYLDDANLFYEFLPARNYNDPQVVPEMSVYDSLVVAPNPHSAVPYMGGTERGWDAANLPHSTSSMLGLKINHEFSSGWEIENNLKVNRNRNLYNTGNSQFAIGLLDPTLATYMHTDRVGTYTYTDKRTGEVLARVVRSTPGTSPTGATVVVNNLPNQSVLPNAVVAQQAYDHTFVAHELMDQLSLTKQFDTTSFKVGVFFARSEFDHDVGANGVGVGPLQNHPQTMNVTLTTPGGVNQQVTNDVGFASLGQRGGGTQTDNTQTQISLFAGNNWQITDQLSTDLGVRYEFMNMKGVNTPEIQNPSSSNPTYGGLDGSPNTLYDNYVVSLGAPIPYEYDLDYLGASGAITYEFTADTSVFVRYSQGKKAPDMFLYNTIDSVAKRDLIKPFPQQVQQVEFGLKQSGDNYSVSLNPFYSKLSDVGTLQNFQRADGSAYANPPLMSMIETIGIEIEGDLDFLDVFNVHSAITIQDPRSKDFAVYVANAPGEADDTVSRVPNGLADNNPKYMATTTLRYMPKAGFTAFATWKYLGERAANRYNTFFLPEFSQFDIGATFDINTAFSISANVNNLLNEEGVMSWGQAGTLSATLDRQAFTPAQRAANPNGLFSILTAQPRSFYLSATMKF